MSRSGIVPPKGLLGPEANAGQNRAGRHTLLDRLRDVRCDREPFTPDHAACICRLTNEAADEIERLLGLK